jgi:hypothetical protein
LDLEFHRPLVLNISTSRPRSFAAYQRVPGPIWLEVRMVSRHILFACAFAAIVILLAFPAAAACSWTPLVNNKQSGG